MSAAPGAPALARAPTLARLMLVTDRLRTRGRDLVPLIGEAVRGGVGLVQIRERDLTDDALRALALRVRDELGESVPLLVNSSLRVARALGLGLHLPADAAPVRPEELTGRPLGRSAHDESEARRAFAEAVSYVLLGTIWPTATKPGRRGAGIALIERVQRLVHPLPIYAIGGMTVSRVPAAIHAGAWGVAVCGAILEDNHPGRVAEALRLALDVATVRT